MKKILLLLSFILCGSVYSQILETENYEALTVGNVSTNITGASPGQGGNYLYATGGAVTDAQIVNEGGTQGQVLQVIGSAANLVKFVYKTGLGASWTARTSGNNVIDVEYDFFTGATTTSKNSFQLRIYDVTQTKTLAGITFAADTKIISGLAYYNNVGTVGNYSFTLGTVAVVLPTNTWVRVGCSFNQTTGEVRWKGPGFDGFIIGAATATSPDEIDFLVAGSTTNTVSSTAKFDNYVSRARATSALLVNNDVVANNFSIYPNPANDIVNIANNSTIEIQSVNITDINGRIVRTIANSIASINISDLSAGVYFLKINTAEGIGTTKLIKN